MHNMRFILQRLKLQGRKVLINFHLMHHYPKWDMKEIVRGTKVQKFFTAIS